MGAKDYTELVVWQLADALRLEILKLTRKSTFNRDLRLRSEIEETASSICRNIPEGFRQRTNRRFAQFLGYSYASCGELKSLLEDAQLKGYAIAEQLQSARTLRYRLDRALCALIRHLRRGNDPAHPGS
jgi:four helix bundle protein